MPNRDTADLVVVGAGTIGGWASVFAKEHGAERVVVLEKGEAGQGASSRAAGIVRAQGGTPETVALGMWSIDFYRSQRDRYGTDSGFRELGYLILATDEEQEREAKARVEMQRAAGLTDVAYVDAAEAARLNPTLDPATFRGGTYAPGDGCVDPPRNVRAYSLAMQRAGVDLRERTPFLGIRTSADGSADGRRDPRGDDRDGAGAPHRWPEAPRGRRARGRPILRRRRPSSGGRHRAARGVRRRTAADGLRERDRPVLASRGRRAPVRHVEPGRGAREGAGGRLALPARDGGADAPLRARSRRTWGSARRGRPRSSTARTTSRSWGRSPREPATRSPASRSPPPSGTG